MWHFGILSIYILIVVYVYIRFVGLLGKARHKIIFSVLYVTLAMAFPGSEFLSDFSSAGWTKYFPVIGYYSLPYLLYQFFMILLFDFFYGVNRLLKIISVEKIHAPNFRFARLLIFLIVPLFIVIAGAMHYNSIKVNRYQINIKKGLSKINHLKIAMVSDFHLREQTSRHFMQDFTAKLNALNPDIVVILGDVLEGDREDEARAEYEHQFRQIKSKYGVYAAFGNHEYHRRQNKVAFFQNANINVLQDSVVLIDRSFYLIGRDNEHANTRKTIDELLKLTTDNVPIIVLDHRPREYDLVSRSKVDIELSGHTHNGQLFPFNYLATYLYDLNWGYKKIRNTHFFVTSGIQGWGPPVRTTGDSEIMLIDIDLIK